MDTELIKNICNLTCEDEFVDHFKWNGGHLESYIVSLTIVKEGIWVGAKHPVQIWWRL